MKKQFRTLAVTAGSIITLLAITVGSVAAMGGAKLTGSARQSDTTGAPLAACAKLEAGEVYFVTLTEDGDIDETVESYPISTTKITAAFDYGCLPKKVAMNIVWSLDGDQILTDEDTPKASDKSGNYTHSIFMKDESELPTGEYTVEFYNGETMLTSGSITVGEVTDGPVVEGDELTVQGTVVDAKSKKPITGALVIVLNEGIVTADWLKDGKDEDVMAFAKTDSKGQFELNNKVPAGVALPWIIGAKGYKTVSQDDFVLAIGSDDPYVMNIGLTKTK
jgi:hypothetical protein